MAQTISMSVGNVAIAHDLRQTISDNVDITQTHRNAVLVDELKPYGYDLDRYTDAYYQPYIDEYNEKQTRAERVETRTMSQRIKDTNDKIIKTNAERKAQGLSPSKKPTKLAYEFVLQYGNHDTNPSLEADDETCKAYFRAVLADLKAQYPHCKILLATYHADEPQGTPHCHILVQFDGEGYKQGISHTVSASKALELEGYEHAGSRKSNYQMQRWVEDVKDGIMTERLHEIVHEERDIIGESREHQTVSEYKERKRAEALTKQADAKQAEVQELTDKLDLVKKRNDVAQKNGELIQADVDRKKAELAEQTAKLNDARASTVKLTEEYFNTAIDLDGLNASVKSKNAQIGNLDKKAEELSNDIKKLKNERDSLQDYDILSKEIAKVELPAMRQTRKGVLIEDADVEIIAKLLKTASVKEGAITSAHEALTNAKARITRAREVLDTQDTIIEQAHKDAQKIRADAKNEVQQLNTKISSLNRQKAELEADTAEAQDVKEELKELKSKRDELAEDVNNNAYLLEELAEMSAHPDEIDATLTDKLIERITREAVTETIHTLDDCGRLQTNPMDCQSQVFMRLSELTNKVKERIQPLIDKPVEIVQDIIKTHHYSR